MSDKGIKSSFHDNDDGEESSWVPNDLVFGKGNLEAIRHTCEAIGSFMEMWGFKKILGSTWAFLYLCPEPAAAKDICKALNISPALVPFRICCVGRSLKKSAPWANVAIITLPNTTPGK